MRVRTQKPRHNKPVIGIDILRIGILLAQLAIQANRRDTLSLHQHRPLFHQLIVTAQRNYRSIANEDVRHNLQHHLLYRRQPFSTLRYRHNTTSTFHDGIDALEATASHQQHHTLIPRNLALFQQTQQSSIASRSRRFREDAGMYRQGFFRRQYLLVRNGDAKTTTAADMAYSHGPIARQANRDTIGYRVRWIWPHNTVAFQCTGNRG